MAGTATVKVIVLGDASKARKALQGLSGDVDKSRSKFSGFGKGLATFGKMAGGALLGVAGASAIAGGAALKMGLDYSNMKDSSMVAFESMLGSAADAKKMWKDVVQFANSTPFDTGTVVNLSKQLLALGKSQKQIIPTIRNIGDLLASQGVSGDAAARAMTAYTQIVGKGKVSMEEINQLAEAGVVIFPALARKLGVSQKKAREMVTAGKVDAATFERAWATAAEKTGGAMDK